MAKKNNEEAQVQEQGAQVTEGTQEGTQQPANGGDENLNNEPAPTPTPTATPTKEAPKAAVAEQGKKVKIHTTEDINCIIACTPYKIAKDKDTQVPADVAAILVNAKKAYRI